MPGYSIKEIMRKTDYASQPVADGISDNEIIARILNGEKELYALIVRRYNERLYRVGMSMISDDAEIEDAMQTAYISAYENLAKFAFKAAFSTWLTRILINQCILRLKQKRTHSVFSNGLTDNYFEKINEVQNPVAGALNSELKSKLEEAIRSLPEKYRLVFVMREIENMSVAETKACLDISEVNVKVRLSRAKALLKNALRFYYSADEIFSFHRYRCDNMVDRVLKKIDTI